MTRPDSAQNPSQKGAESSIGDAPSSESTARSATSATGTDTTSSTSKPATEAPRDMRTVLGGDEIARAMRRMAHEIIEGNKGADDLVVLGIPTRGVHVGRRLAALMGEVEGREIPVGTLDVTFYRDDLRRNPTRRMEPTTIPAEGIDDKVVVLADDVLYSGRTIRAALDAIGDIGRPRAVRLAVLVDRGHRDLPIRADHVGKNLPTSSRERVHVSLAETDGVDQVDISGGDR
ncbi:bifunctional pyr operon transcriptional regulator/uracil phosphoribosyltransferase PyrR [Mobilicoccus caccae]|uniref:Bifunctional protein PyrR n=1 Tax=Mobilicoccus caccae TaxID=1859295 RepID=A0ABQ6IQ87_9MICO|nr:bifunctional pyr operon transcriptional regulator/uracil phosphoribosyltransferase PyrR [Mobilicoccus caccae]GMA39911.1 bifunctional protein PyrR [Mobilicoccus caccae]